MICDAHVHVGYYSRMGHDAPFYYSPRRVTGILDRCGIKEFIVSSTCSQIKGARIADIVREAREIKRLSGRSAHIFFWLSGHLYDEDRSMGWADMGLFEGIKLHEIETPWLKYRRDDLRAILSAAEKKNMPAMLHSGITQGCCPEELAEIASAFPSVRFNFAHCRPIKAMAEVIGACPNVWTDTAYMPFDEFDTLNDYDWHGRLMFGTDIPVWQAHESTGLTRKYRDYMSAIATIGLERVTENAFQNFIGAGRSDRHS